MQIIDGYSRLRSQYITADILGANSSPTRRGLFRQYSVLRALYTCDFARCDCHPGVCNKLMTDFTAGYPHMIRCSLSSKLSSVKHILQDVNRKAQSQVQTRLNPNLIISSAVCSTLQLNTYSKMLIARDKITSVNEA